MANKDERYLNVTLKNENDNKDDVVISLSGIFKKLKKYFLIWLVTAVVAGVLILTGTAVFSSDQHKTLTALVSFTYDGIEEGLDPDGNEFDVNTLKNPSVIEAALTELGQPLDLLENIRQSISIEYILPGDAIDKITTYKSVYENAQSGALSAAQAMLDVKYYPTQYRVSFNYAETGLSSNDAVQVFNTVLECYRDYFFETYGYNKALGNAVTALDYTDYDYAEAVDVFDSTLSTLKSYVDNLAKDDTTRFRSTETGYTFSDLSEAIKTLRDMDLDILSSYITLNNVTKDKESLITYYQYRIDSLTRQKVIAEETLAAITQTIDAYEKDVVMIFGNGTDNTDTQYSQSSEEYDNLIKQKVTAQTDVSTTTQQISYYNQRITALQGKSAASDEKKERVEADLEKLNEKINTLIDSINKTADEYYENVSFANAYNILVPASSSAVSIVQKVISGAMLPAVIVEVLLFIAYFCTAFVTAIIDENKKKKAREMAGEAASEEPEADADVKEEKKNK